MKNEEMKAAMQSALELYDVEYGFGLTAKQLTRALYVVASMKNSHPELITEDCQECINALHEAQEFFNKVSEIKKEALGKESECSHSLQVPVT